MHAENAMPCKQQYKAVEIAGRNAVQTPAPAGENLIHIKYSKNSPRWAARIFKHTFHHIPVTKKVRYTLQRKLQ